MTSNKTHDDLIVFDGLIVSNWDESVFKAMREGGLTAANCTCSIWENFRDTMLNIGHWNQMFTKYSDYIMKAASVDEIRRAKSERKTAIVLGFQNTSAFEDRVEFVELFKQQGVGIVQMTYNTQNLVGSGCYERTDGGLSDFGRDIVLEMNRVGILCDLSHVGSQTTEDVIRTSQKPVAYSHCLPSKLKSHPRNKSDEQLRLIADHEGFIGVTMFPPFLKRGNDASIEDYVEAIDYVINLVGENCVGIGTDFTMGYDSKFFEYINRDKGTGRKLTEIWEVNFPDGLKDISDYPNLTLAMEKSNWSESKIRKVMGENWLTLLERVW